MRNFNQIKELLKGKDFSLEKIEETTYRDVTNKTDNFDKKEINSYVDLFNNYSESLKAKKYTTYKTSIDNVVRLPTQKYNPLSNFFINTNINNPTNLDTKVIYPPITIN